jgi:hypothetical protein
LGTKSTDSRSFFTGREGRSGVETATEADVKPDLAVEIAGLGRVCVCVIAGETRGSGRTFRESTSHRGSEDTSVVAGADGSVLEYTESDAPRLDALAEGEWGKGQVGRDCPLWADKNGETEFAVAELDSMRIVGTDVTRETDGDKSRAMEAEEVPVAEDVLLCDTDETMLAARLEDDVKTVLLVVEDELPVALAGS